MYVDENELIIMYYALIMKMNELLTKQTFITQIKKYILISGTLHTKTYRFWQLIKSFRW